MSTPLTYGECLRDIMHAHHISINDLTRKIGFRSTTSLMRILKDETSAEAVRKFHDRFRLLSSWLITPADIERLSAALRYTQLGPEGFRLHRAMERLFFKPAYTPEQYPVLSLFSPALKDFTLQASAPFSSLDQLIQFYARAGRVDVIIINAQSQNLCSALARLVRFSPHSRSIRHYFQVSTQAADIGSMIASTLPLLTESAYEGYYCTSEDPNASDFLSQHNLILVRCEQQPGEIRTHLFVPIAENHLSVCAFPGSDLYDFYLSLTDHLREVMHPIKAPTAANTAPSSLLELTERHLLEETSRPLFSLQPDPPPVCTPTEILRSAVSDGEGIGVDMDHPLIDHFISVHQARRQNFRTKKEPTYFVFSTQGLRSFASTGRRTHHFPGMRAFTAAERITILRELITQCNQNSAYHVNLLQPHVLTPEYALIGFGDLGVLIAPSRASYSTSTHKEALISLPSFVQAYETYFVKTLIPDFCLSQEESLAFIQSLIDELQSQS